MTIQTNRDTVWLDSWDEMELVREWVDWTEEGGDRYDCFVLHENGTGASLTAAANLGELDCGGYQLTAEELKQVHYWEDWVAEIGAYDPDYTEENA